MGSQPNEKTVSPAVNILQERQQMWKNFTKFSVYVTLVVIVALGLMRIFLIH